MSNIDAFPLFNRYKATARAYLDAVARQREHGELAISETHTAGVGVLAAEVRVAAAALELARGAYLDDPLKSGDADA